MNRCVTELIIYCHLKKDYSGRYLQALSNMLCPFSFVAVNNSVVGNISEGHLIIQDLKYHLKPF